jgi:hypothetical protein
MEGRSNKPPTLEASITMECIGHSTAIILHLTGLTYSAVDLTKFRFDETRSDQECTERCLHSRMPSPFNIELQQSGRGSMKNCVIGSVDSSTPVAMHHVVTGGCQIVCSPG